VFLRAALSWAARQKLIPSCPAFPEIKPPRKKPQPVAAESFERLLAKAPDHQTRTFLLSGWLAGLRLSEAHALEWEQTESAPWVDFRRGRIVLPAGFVKAVEDQWVPLDAELRAALLALPRLGPRVFYFPSALGGWLPANGVCQMVRQLARRAGVLLTMKSLRKGFGCYYAARVPAQALQKLMRHANIQTTMDYYANVDDAVEAAVRQRGASRNDSRNNAAAATPESAPEADATPCPDGTNQTPAE
jgi:integrase